MRATAGGRAILVWGTTLSIFLLVSYASCIVFGLLAPTGLEMHRAWGPWLPGFEWLTVRGVLAGAAWCIIYGFWSALLLVPLRRVVGKQFGEIAAGE
ncbi:MAG: hypothetical protein M3R64_12995 [Pseudomonadota bacterium]|nr:hypothetical protein [Pseudomonadota bacterium]